MNRLLAKVTNPFLEGTGLDSPAPGEAKSLFSRVLSGIIEILLFIAFIYFLINFILAGIGWIASQGDENRVKASRDRVMNSIIGLTIAFSIFVVLKVVGQVFGIASLQDLALPFSPIID